MRIALSGTVLSLLFLGASGILPDSDSLETIRVEDLRSELHFLASDEMQGRGLRTPFNELTARYLAKRLEGFGLQPGVEDSFFEPFELVQAGLGRPLKARLFDRRGRGRPLTVRADFYPAPHSADGRARARVVFAGFGIVAPELARDDYQGLDVRDKIVLVLDHEPGEDDPSSPFDGLVLSDYGREFHKIVAAQQRGAVGVLIAPDTANHSAVPLSRIARREWPADPEETRPLLGALTQQIHIPAAYVSQEIAEALLEGTDQSLGQLQQLSEEGRQFPPPDRSPQFELQIQLEREIFTARNVLARLEGSDAVLKDEWVIIGAHFDHVGTEGEQIYNGADDNASGTVGLLEVAEAYAISRWRPRRSILFALFNAEERGLLGSYYFVDHPVVPLSGVAAMLQMDMIGRDEEVPERKGFRFRGLETQAAEQNSNAVNILGYSRSERLKEWALAANQPVGLDLRFRYDNHPIGLLRRSDNWPFLTRGIPALFFHTGLHPDYHRPSDTPEKINYEKMARIVRLVYLTSWQAANQDERPDHHLFRPGVSP